MKQKPQTYPDADEENNSVSEPAVSYSIPLKKLPFHSVRPATLEILEDERRHYTLHLSPSERFAYLKQLNINAFGKKSLLIKSLGTVIYKKQ